MSDPSTKAVIVDSDEFFRLALGKILTADLGFREVQEMTISSVLVAAADGLISADLVIVEASLLDSDHSLIRTLRRHDPNARIVVVSASRTREMALRSMELGSHGHVLKGGSVAEMGYSLKMVLDGMLWLPSFVADLGGESKLETTLDSTLRAPTGGLRTLTTRQREVLRLVVLGKSNKEIARMMQLREGTIKVHMAGLFRKLNVVNRSSAAVLGERLFLAEGTLKAFD